MAAAVPASPAAGLPDTFRYATAVGAPFVSAFPSLATLPNQLLLYTHAAQQPQPMLLTGGQHAHAHSLSFHSSAALPFFPASSPSASPVLVDPSFGAVSSSSSPLKASSASSSSDQPLHLSAFSAFVPAHSAASISASVLSSTASPAGKAASAASASHTPATARPASSAAIASLLNLSHSASAHSTSSAPSLLDSTAATHAAMRMQHAAAGVKVEQQQQQQQQQQQAGLHAPLSRSPAPTLTPASAASSARSISSFATREGGSRSSRVADSAPTLESTASRLIERLTDVEGQAAALNLLRSLSTSASSLTAVQSVIDAASRHLSDPSTTTANFLISLTAWLVNEVATSAPSATSPLSPFSSSSASELSKRRRSLPPLPATSDSDDDTCPHCCAQKKGTRWSDKDDGNMLAMLKQGNDWEHIAKALKRTVRALKDRYCYLRKQMRKSGGSGERKKKRKKRDDVSEHASSDFDSDFSSTDDDDSDDDTHRSTQRPASLPSKPHDSAASTSGSSTSQPSPSLGSSHTSQRSRSNDSAGNPADSPPRLSPPSSPSSSTSSFSSGCSSLSETHSASPSMHPWSEAEEVHLFALLSAGRTIREASRQLGRSVAAVKGRLQRLKRSKNKRRLELQQHEQHDADDDMDLAEDSVSHNDVHSKSPMTQAAAALLLAGA